MNECLFMIFYFVWCHCRCNMNEFFLVVGAIDDFTCYGDYVNFGTLMSVLRKKRTFFLHFIINMIFYTRVFLLWVLLHQKVMKTFSFKVFFMLTMFRIVSSFSWFSFYDKLYSCFMAHFKFIFFPVCKILLHIKWR